MLEVYTGYKAGRPTLLLLLSAGLLVGVLGLAQWQVVDARALGPETRIPGTPVIFRPPKGWVHSTEDPGTFLHAVRTDAFGTQRYERRLTFGFERLREYRSPEQLLVRRGINPRFATPANIGKFQGLQIIERRQMRVRGQVLVKEQASRIVCLPNGILITAEYVPLLNLSEGDLDTFQHSCDTVRLDEQYLQRPPQDVLKQAGLALDLKPDWVVTGPEVADVPGLFLALPSESGPRWSVGLYRTWLSAGRSLEDLALDAAAEAWLLSPEDLNQRSWRRADGGDVLYVEHPGAQTAEIGLPAICIVARAPHEAAIGFIYADARLVPETRSVVEQLFNTLRFEQHALFDALESAADAGARLAGELTERGPVGWWGRERSSRDYLGESMNGREVRSVSRWANDRLALNRGFRGTHVVRGAGRDAQERELSNWTVDERGVGYALDWRAFVADVRVNVDERRAGADTAVTRRVTIENVGLRAASFHPNQSFVGPPLEELAAERVSRLPGRTALIQCSAPLGRAGHMRLLQAEPDGDGWRVLELRDYWPTGREFGFDNGEGPAYILSPGRRWERVTRHALLPEHSLTI